MIYGLKVKKKKLWFAPKILKKNIKMDDEALKEVPKFNYVGILFTEDGKSKENIIKRIKETKCG